MRVERDQICSKRWWDQVLGHRHVRWDIYDCRDNQGQAVLILQDNFACQWSIKYLIVAIFVIDYWIHSPAIMAVVSIWFILFYLFLGGSSVDVCPLNIMSSSTCIDYCLGINKKSTSIRLFLFYNSKVLLPLVRAHTCWYFSFLSLSLIKQINYRYY